MAFLRKRRSILTIVGITLAITLLLSSSIAASSGVKLSASTESGVIGSEVIVKINATNAVGNEGGQFDLSFDPTIIEPVSASRGDFVPDVSGNIFDRNLELESGKVRVLWVVAAGSSKTSGTIGTITFKLLKAGETHLTFNDIVISPDTLGIDSSVSGRVTVIDANVAKQEAIEKADNAIANLPQPGQITLADKAAVEAARALVNKAINDHGAVNADFANLQKLVGCEAIIAKLNAIKAAEDAILALPSVDSLTLDDKNAVSYARSLVNSAKQSHGAVDADFAYLARLTAAENRIRELEGLAPTPPTGGSVYYVLGAILLGVAGIFYLRQRRLLFFK